ncbi:Propanediol utilization protein [Granulicatella balaenopterae]|uniref:Phosphate propanoyltransferase n=1 Tax=Granulicatella balaenopterae TaxID=137733 RepID=A0A1H9HA65_9LACT|nr:phosphate propanoyltransferase [Granulicatella balaenopterae]SEQ59259.1 Propanediol utilization protein [Granulicatella balaenopterae]
MANYDQFLQLLKEAIAENNEEKDIKKIDAFNIPVGISNRHIHLSQETLERLFGEGYELTKLKDLSQPGQYACKETVMVCGPKGVIEKVRILGPVRKETQVEILVGDSFKLGVKPVVRMSGKLEETPSVTLVGPKGSCELDRGVIVAQRHIHMLPSDAEALGVKNHDIVSLEVGGIRGGILNDVIIRAVPNSQLECHIDTEEANALGITPKTALKLIK